MKNCSIFSNSFTSLEASCITEKSFYFRIGKSNEDKVGTVANKNISFNIWGSSVSRLCSERALPDLFALPVTYMVGEKPEVVLARDMNNDEYPDILVVNSASRSLTYLEGIGDGTFKDSQTIETGREPFALDVADFNGDRIPDIALCNYGDGNVSIILGRKTDCSN